MKQKLLYLPFFYNPDHAKDISEDTEYQALKRWLSEGWKIVQISATNYSHREVKGLQRPCCYILLEKED